MRNLYKAVLDHYLNQARISYEQILLQKPLGCHNIIQYFSSVQTDQSYCGCFMVDSLGSKSTIPEGAFKASQELVLYVEDLYKMHLQKHKSPEAISHLILTLDLGLAVTLITKKDQNFLENIVQQVKALLS